MAAACGGCHGAVGAQVELPPLPSDGEGDQAVRLHGVWNALIPKPTDAPPGPAHAAKRLLATASCPEEPTAP